MTDTCSWRIFLLVCLHPSVPILFLVLQGQLWGHLESWEGDAAPSRPRVLLSPSGAGCSSGDNPARGLDPSGAELMEQRGSGEGAGAAQRALLATQGLLSPKGQKAAKFDTCSSVTSQKSEICQRSPEAVPMD